MDRLSILLTLMTGAVATGTLIILFFTLNWYGWGAVATAAIIGFAAAWPVGYAISRQIKRRDPDWSERRVDRADGVVPDRKAPEV